LGQEVTVVGSAALGCALKDADVDICVRGSLRAIWKQLRDGGVAVEPFVEDLAVIRARVDDLEVDIQEEGNG
jgi:hypothetical protein